MLRANIFKSVLCDDILSEIFAYFDFSELIRDGNRPIIDLLIQKNGCDKNDVAFETAIEMGNLALLEYMTEKCTGNWN